MLQLHVAGCLSSVFPGDSTLGPEISYPCSVQPSNPFLEGKSCYLLTYAYMAAFTMVLDALPPMGKINGRLDQAMCRVCSITEAPHRSFMSGPVIAARPPALPRMVSFERPGPGQSHTRRAVAGAIQRP